MTFQQEVKDAIHDINNSFSKQKLHDGPSDFLTSDEYDLLLFVKQPRVIRADKHGEHFCAKSPKNSTFWLGSQN
jgi:hypothetical protein